MGPFSGMELIMGSDEVFLDSLCIMDIVVYVLNGGNYKV